MIIKQLINFTVIYYMGEATHFIGIQEVVQIIMINALVTYVTWFLA